MRDHKRIDKFCEMLKAYWHMAPDLRFMQLVCNLQAQIGSDGFYLEDDKTMELIEQMLKRYNPEYWIDKLIADLQEAKQYIAKLKRKEK